MTDSPRTEQAKTEAEAAFSAQFAALQKDGAFAESSGHGFLPSLAERRAAYAQLEQNGLPTRRAESWHYTDLRRHLGAVAPFAGEAKGAVLPPLLKGAAVLALINGAAQQTTGAAEAGIHAAALAGNSFAEMPFSVLQAEEQRDKGDIIGVLNTAFARDGWHIDVEGGSKAMRFIELQNIQNGGQAHSRFPVHIGQNAHITVLERQIGDNAESFLTSAAEVKLAEGAELRWIILRERGSASAEMNRFQAVLGKNAQLTLYVVNAGCGFLRQEINVDLAGEQSGFQLRGINLLAGASHTDTTLIVRHLAENTDSAEIFRNVVSEEARGVFQGMIRVAQNAQKTDARMACNSLILSDKAEFDAKPELEIFADDVACGHGATVAELNESQLFYLMARGIPKGVARALLVKAFVSELIDELPEDLAETLHGVVEAWLKSHFHAA